MIRVNIGCGGHPTPGWLNYDKSLCVRLAKHPMFTYILDKLGFLGEGHRRNISIAKNSNIMWADAAKRIPLPDRSVEVLYSSHMLEHLDGEEAKAFLKEACRVLSPNGIIRITVPDISKFVDEYASNKDADAFIEKTLLTRRRPKTLFEKMKYLIIGEKNHQWMYDGISLVKLLSSVGLKKPCVLPVGSTTIPDPGELVLPVSEDDSVYVEAYNA